MHRLLFLIPIILFGLFAALAFVGMGRDDPDAVPSVQIGNPAPPVTLVPLSGQVPFIDADLATGQVSLVNFWASWCGPCRSEHPNLATLAAKGVPIFGVNHKDRDANAQAFLTELGDPYTGGGADPDGVMSLDWGVYGLPETFVIGPDGTVLYRLAGPLTARNYRDRVLPALAELGVVLPALGE